MGEHSRNIETAPMGATSRIRRIAGFVLDHIRSAPDHASDHYRPSSQIDVGKSAAKAADVQLVIEGLQKPESFSPFHGTYSQPEGSFGWTDRPDPPDAA